MKGGKVNEEIGKKSGFSFSFMLRDFDFRL
jgi:hypothetical protein